MKHVKKLLGLVLVLSALMSTTAFAREMTWEEAPGHHDDGKLLPESVQVSVDQVESLGRGEIISKGMVELKNLGGSSMHISISTYAHRPVDWISHTVFLDQWDEGAEEWVQVDSWDFERSKEEEPDLTYWSTGFTLSEIPGDQYYRVRGLHTVELDGETEGLSSRTQGVFITE